MRLIAPLDAIYLWTETTNSPTHVIALQIFKPRPGSGPELMEEIYSEMTDPALVKPTFKRKPHRSLATGRQWVWVEDDDMDMTVHVRRTALPHPGRIRELLEYVSTIHSTVLDRGRPLWEARLVEGLQDGRFALCTKLHHSLFDGVNMGRHLLGGLSTDPDARDSTAPWIIPMRHRDKPPRPADPTPSVLQRAREVVESVGSMGGSLAGSVKTLSEASLETLRSRAATLPFTAPNSVLNGSVGSARRFAGDAWPVSRLKVVAKKTGSTINDVGMAMCGGALRSYLAELGELPSAGLVAMAPVSLIGTDGGAAPKEGNAFGAVLANLGTDLDDPLERLRRIHVEMRRNKSLMTDLDPFAATVVSGATMSGALLNSVPGLPMTPRPPFNLVISNVPLAKRSLYYSGCEVDAFYPVSVVLEGQALNITLVSYRDEIAIGLTGCRRRLPHLQRLLIHLETALIDLEKAVIALPEPIG
ncbi:MAG: WS/DGAT/MGAT family O-acyltransferase [Pseudonocardia sp.]